MTGWSAPSVHVQAAALQAAFPDYLVTVIARLGDRPRFELVCRDSSGDPYCLISDDASEIWQELQGESL
jgi:hypothetical protein